MCVECDVNRKGEGSERQGPGPARALMSRLGGHAGCVVWKGPLAAEWGQAGRPVPGNGPGRRCEARWELEGALGGDAGGREVHKAGRAVPGTQ